MVLLGILAAVAVPRMSQSILAGEEAAEQKFLANMISAIEVRANDEFVRNSRKQYTVDPFDALDKYPSRDSNGEGWWTENRSDGNDCCVIVEVENIKDLLLKSGIGEMMDLNTPGTMKLWALDTAEIIMKSTLSKENIQYLVLALMDKPIKA